MTNAPTPRPDEAVARLIAAIDDFEADADDAHETGENVATWDQVVEVDISDLRLVLSALASRAEEIAVLREALEPFSGVGTVLAGDLFPDSHPICTHEGLTLFWRDKNGVVHELRVADFRRAARALTPGEGGNG